MGCSGCEKRHRELAAKYSDKPRPTFGNTNTKNVPIETSTHVTNDLSAISLLKEHISTLSKGGRLMRKSCLSCALKHIAQASVLLSESFKGYPNHFWFSLGHLAEAEDELIRDYKDISNLIRDVRLTLEKDKNYPVDFNILITSVLSMQENPNIPISQDNKKQKEISTPLKLEMPLSDYLNKGIQLPIDSSSSVEVSGVSKSAGVVESTSV